MYTVSSTFPSEKTHKGSCPYQSAVLNASLLSCQCRGVQNMQIELTLWSRELNVLECVAKQCLALELNEQCKKH